MDEVAKQLLSDSLVNDMLFNARLDFAIEEEVSFVLAAAHLDGLLLAGKVFDKVYIYLSK